MRSLLWWKDLYFGDRQSHKKHANKYRCIRQYIPCKPIDRLFAAHHGNRLGRIMIRFTRGWGSSLLISMPPIYSHIVLYSDQLNLVNDWKKLITLFYHETFLEQGQLKHFWNMEFIFEDETPLELFFKTSMKRFQNSFSYLRRLVFLFVCKGPRDSVCPDSVSEKVLVF